MLKPEDTPNTNPPDNNNPYGSYKNETAPNAQDGTAIKAEQVMDIYSSLLQIIQQNGEVPDGNLENGGDQKQFVRNLLNLGIMAYSNSIVYKLNAIVFIIDNESFKLYQSLKNNNTDPLSNKDSWKYISFGGGSGFIGQFSYGIRTDNPQGFLRCDGNQYPADAYADFVNQYIVTNKIPNITLAQYNTQLANNNDNCGYFGYSSTSNILRVPKLKDNVFIAQALTTGNICKYNEEGLPNITGKIIPYTGYGGTAEGAFFNTPYPDSRTASWGSGATIYTSFDASLSNPIYGNSDHVTPNHIQYPLFICVSNQSQPITEDNLNLFIEGLTGKLSSDISNITTEGKEKSVNMVMPSTSYTNFSIASGVIYTMPADGWIVLKKPSTAAGQYVTVESQSISRTGFTSYAHDADVTIGFTLAVRKGDQIKLTFTAGGGTIYYRLVYAEGEKP